MSTYKTIFIPTENLEKRKMYSATIFKVDALNLANEIQALLYEYEQKGYILDKMEAVISGTGASSYTDGFIVVLKKKEI